MKNKLLYVILISFLYVGCDMGDFGNLNTDPNKPTDFDTRFLYITSAAQVGTFFRDDWSARDQMYPHYFSEWRTVQHGEMQVLDYSMRNKYVRIIKPLDEIIMHNQDVETKSLQKVVALGSNANQIAMCKIMRAYFYLHYTDLLGAIPYTEANNGKDNFFPKYDSQEFIYKDLYKQLKEAVEGFDNGLLNGDYDPFYFGEISKWKKLGNSIRMIMSMRLSKVDPTTGAKWFNETPHTSADFISDNSDNFIHRFKKEYDADIAENNNVNPIWQNVVLEGRNDYAPTKMIVDYMNSNDDPRLSAYFLKAIKTDTYVGVPFGINKEDIALYPEGTLSVFNDKFIAQDAAIPMITAAQMQFTLAEAIIKYGVGGSAKDAYEMGIKRSLEQHSVSEHLSVYLAKSGVAFGNFVAPVDNQIKQIAQQKWLSTYMQDGFEAWTEARRMGWPDLKVGPAAQTLNAMPRRLKYHSDDYSSNMIEYKKVLAMQGANEITTRLWWDKE